MASICFVTRRPRGLMIRSGLQNCSLRAAICAGSTLRLLSTPSFRRTIRTLWADLPCLTSSQSSSISAEHPWTGEVKGPASFTFLNGWQDYNDGNVVTSASFVLTTEGYVELFGMIKGGTLTDGTVVAQSPAGYRPLNPGNAITYSLHTQKFAVWSISPNGNVMCASGLAVAGVSLAGIKFRRGN